LKKRSFLYGAAAVAGAGALAAWRYWPEQGLWNPCLGPLPPDLANHELVRAAWRGLDAAQVWDSHAHLVGTGDSGSGIYTNPKMESLLHPAQYGRRRFFLNGACVDDAKADADGQYVARVRGLLEGIAAAGGAGAKLVLLALDRAHDERGKPDLENSTFYVPDAYTLDVARRYPQLFEWAASVHPYRDDAIEALREAKRGGARALKWLPSSMNIDPATPRCQQFYDELRKLDLPLIVHAGEERAATGHGAEDFGNPLRLRRALEAGVRVVVAHCAALGKDVDLDKGESGPKVESFELFTRIFEKYPNCYADISAMTQVNRAGPALARVIETEAWHARLLNGSDYPLPGVMPVFSVDFLVSLKLLPESAAPVLKQIRSHNPLLFDFVTKRTLRSNGRAFAARVFETRGFFMR